MVTSGNGSETRDWCLRGYFVFQRDIFNFFLAAPGACGISLPRDRTCDQIRQPWPEPEQRQLQILNPLSHMRTPRGIFWYLNYLNFYHVNSTGLTYIIETKMKFTFNNKRRKEDRLGGRKTSCWRPRKTGEQEKVRKRTLLKGGTLREKKEWLKKTIRKTHCDHLCVPSSLRYFLTRLRMYLRSLCRGSVVNKSD